MQTAAEAERALALDYAPAAGRAGVHALFALDRTLADVLRTTRDPMVGQLRLTWWHDALSALGERPAPAQPVLRALEADAPPHGVSGAELAPLVEGWEALLEPGALSPDRLDAHARGRGAALFALAGRVCRAGPGDPLDAGGRGWALADLAAHLSDPGDVTAARDTARPLLEEAARRRWSRGGRALAALVDLARADLTGTAPGAPGRVGRLLWRRVTGR